MILNEIHGTVLLGDTFSILEITDFKWFGQNIIIDSLINGSLETKACALAIRRVQLLSSPNFSLKQNSLNNEISILITNPDLLKVSLIIYNSMGMEIKRFYQNEIFGTNVIKISTEELSSGNYFCILNYGMNKITKSFLVLK